MPTQNTKLVMSHAHPTGWFRPQIPMPSQNSHDTASPRIARPASDGMKNSHHPIGAAPSTGAATASVMEWKSGERRMRGGWPATGLSRSSASVVGKPYPRVGGCRLSRDERDEKVAALYYRGARRVKG